jgi:hypothetical protein
MKLGNLEFTLFRIAMLILFTWELYTFLKWAMRS